MFKDLKLLKVFFESSLREFNVREIAKEVKITPATASKALKDLVKKKILKVRFERVYHLYKANLEEDSYRDLKLWYNLRKIKESGLLEEINKFYLKPTVVFFGSGADGSDTEDSDLDLLIISERKMDFPNQKIWEKKLNRKLQLVIVTEIKELGNKHLINNILNGLVIQGEVKWI
ncbi:MAG TPA: nucleotidyltransferase domain-containing protein [Candidatus Nanoarchaeia archaeon]|nr:nucleotidyltransferase domain-containing protein [Candidatus Nanoarchaeia archaeon]